MNNNLEELKKRMIEAGFAGNIAEHCVELEKEIQRLKTMLFHFTGKME